MLLNLFSTETNTWIADCNRSFTDLSGSGQLKKIEFESETEINWNQRHFSISVWYMKHFITNSISFTCYDDFIYSIWIIMYMSIYISIFISSNTVDLHPAREGRIVMAVCLKCRQNSLYSWLKFFVGHHFKKTVCCDNFNLFKNGWINHVIFQILLKTS